MIVYKGAHYIPWVDTSYIYISQNIQAPYSDISLHNGILMECLLRCYMHLENYKKSPVKLFTTLHIKYLKM